MSSPKQTKSNKIVKANLEFSCKFRGKYDLSKNKKNNEISLENAVNLFEVIHKKNDKLFKDTSIKMYKEKKTFSFADQKSFSKIRHRVPYVQVKKFFVLHKDPTMVIMGVNHKTHRWFLVFQFSNTEDLTKFCDEIEGEKKQGAEEVIADSPTNDEIDENNTEGPLTDDIAFDDVERELSDLTMLDVPEIQIDGQLQSATPTFDESKNDDFERLSIHSEIYNANLATEESNFDDSYYEPDMEPENVLSESSFVEEASPSINHSRPLSRISVDSDFDDSVHCDNYSRSKLKDLMMRPDHVIYDNLDEWNEELKCMEYPKEFDEPHFNKNGPVYIYSAHHKISCKQYQHSCSVSSEEDKN